MRKSAFWAMCLSSSFALCQIAGNAPTNQDIQDLVKTGLSDDVILAKIRTSECTKFNTSIEAIKELKGAGVSDSVIQGLIECGVKRKTISPQPSVPAVSAEVQAEREKLSTSCPGCSGIMAAYVDAQTGQVTYDWYSKHQLEWIKEQQKLVDEGKVPKKLRLVKHKENAHFIVYWTYAVGSKPYVLYVPHTTTDNGSLNGSFRNYTTGEYGTYDGTISVQHTDYRAVQAERSFVNVTATVYDNTGKKIYETTHQGNYRWSKPDKDVLRESIEFLRSLP